jgi:glycosyltransferase involved in cell wall biosynthesis
MTEPTARTTPVSTTRVSALTYSIVVPCYNEADYVGDTLASLGDQTFGGQYEVVVVDNNCTDATADIARAHGARVVTESNRGVCWARQRGTTESTGAVVISADADTRYAPDWLAKIDQHFAAGEGVVAVVGPCVYVGGPMWGRWYARALFGAVSIVYRLTGRTYYVSATNIAFRKECWNGYDTNLTQGGDELNLLRELKAQGRVVYDHSNKTYTSSRRLTRGLLYGFFVTTLYYYLLAYFLNRVFKREVIGSAPAFRRDAPASNRLQTTAAAVATGFLLLLPFSTPRHFIWQKSETLVDYMVDMIRGYPH